MSLWIVVGWNPLGEQRPADDGQVFELLTAAVFQARFRPDVVQARWPSIRQGFANFDVKTVAMWPDEKSNELLEFEGMIRNAKKIRATLRNARELRDLGKRFGSALQYLRSLRQDEEALVRDIDTWAHYIGAPSIRWFVRALNGGQQPGGQQPQPALAMKPDGDG